MYNMNTNALIQIDVLSKFSLKFEALPVNSPVFYSYENKSLSHTYS